MEKKGTSQRFKKGEKRKSLEIERRLGDNGLKIEAPIPLLTKYHVLCTEIRKTTYVRM